MRSESDCIFSTSKSINKDNSLLNCRIEGLNYYKPDLFIVDLNLKLKKNLFLNKIIKKRKTYIITKKENSKKSIIYKKKGFCCNVETFDMKMQLVWKSQKAKL